VKEVSGLLRLEPYLERKPSALSGGQRQRVAIGRAIVRDPKVFLFDEPLSNLDAELRVEMRLQISELRRRLKATFIYVTHDQVEAMTLADVIVVLRNGVIEQVGSPIELYHHPANRFVAGFIGSPKMNFIPAATAGVGGAAEVGVRPEHLRIESTGALKGIVKTVENLGAVSYAYAALPDDTLVTVQLPPDHAVVIDQPLALSIVEGRSHRFDADGKTLV
jgi:multiple sugar transport system ATP-binding protein